MNPTRIAEIEAAAREVREVVAKFDALKFHDPLQEDIAGLAAMRFIRTHGESLCRLANQQRVLAEAVAWAYDQWEHGDDGCGEFIEKSTGKHPFDWTREALLAHLGMEGYERSTV